MSVNSSSLAASSLAVALSEKSIFVVSSIPSHLYTTAITAENVHIRTTLILTVIIFHTVADTHKPLTSNVSATVDCSSYYSTQRSNVKKRCY